MNSSWSEFALDPLERSSEIMFGLIMALTFTCTVSVVASTNDVRTMLAAALSCNIAWGLVDGAMYVLAEIVARQRKNSAAMAVAGATPVEARRMLLETLPDGAERVFSPEDLDRLVKGIRAMPVAPHSMVPNREDLHGAVAIFLLVFLSTFPVALPFLFISDLSLALRTSNAIAIVSLFLVGTGLGRYMNWPHPWAIGLIVAVFGAILVAITIALGG
jgi:VIT1/CCC1 family predicted Fe2+/Mn2+ transporter